MSTTDQPTSDAVDLFSPEWCEHATRIWKEVATPCIADPANFDYIVEWGDTDTGACSQTKAVPPGIVEVWQPGQPHGTDGAQFQLWASRDTWRKIGDGKLDPVAAVAAKRLHLRKGPMAVVIKESQAFSRLLAAWGRIPTAW
ncbi:MAG: hypothetical protein ACRDY7_06290 [Acidimicrobiia bacterium]